MTLALLAMLAASTLSAQENTPAALMIVTPKNVSIGASSSAIHEVVAEAIEARTSLTVSSLERAGVDELAMRRCGFAERYGCWARTVRRAFGAARFLFVVDAHPGRIGLTAIDLEEARRIDEGPGSVEAKEDLLFARTRSTPLEAVQFRRAVFRAHIDRRLESVFRPQLGATWGALPRIVIDAGSPGSTLVAIDGRTLGAFSTRTATITDVRPGRREITLSRDDRVLLTQKIDVSTATPNRIVVPVEPTRSPLRTTLFWSGVGVAAVGALVAVYGAAATSDDTQARCFQRSPGAACPSLGALGFGYTAPAGPTTDPSAVDGGPEFVPVAIGLGTMGAVWSVSALLLGDEEPPLWWSAVIGLVGGVASFAALSLAL